MMSAMDIFKLRRARHTKWVEQYLIDQRLKPLEPPEIAVLRKDREVPLPHLKIIRSDIVLFLCVNCRFDFLFGPTLAHTKFLHIFCIESKAMGIEKGLTDGEMKWLGWVEADALLNGLNHILTDNMGYLMLSNWTCTILQCFAFQCFAFMGIKKSNVLLTG
jgi:hypothetical protein